jgi:hypothetical protein
MRTREPGAPCAAGCGVVATERNRYFTGKYMTARDFWGEQEYFLSRHRLHNRLLHGWGIVCGLRVIPHPIPECADRWVVVRAGIAIDCCGRELILRQDTPFELPLPRPPEPSQENPERQEGASDQQERPHQQGGQGHIDAPQHQGTPPQESLSGPFLLCLRYREQEIERVPALYVEGTCDPTRQEANRVREVACLDVCSLDDVEAGCWRMPGGDPEARCRDDCDDELPGPAGACLEPECPCGEMVPLALITFDPAHPEARFEINTLGRRHLPPPIEFLTHIVSINWPHGGTVSLSHLRESMQGRLEVRFDRKLLDNEGEATGINEHTFIVQYGGVQRDVEFLPSTDDSPTMEEDCLAVFRIEPSKLDPNERRANIAGNVVYVTLKCDFILDCHENPVDGDHMRGQLPSGNGMAGGVFESWFRVTYE